MEQLRIHNGTDDLEQMPGMPSLPTVCFWHSTCWKSGCSALFILGELSTFMVLLHSAVILVQTSFSLFTLGPLPFCEERKNCVDAQTSLLLQVRPFEPGQAPVNLMPIPVASVPADGSLATAVNSSILALQQQPSVVKYQEMMANYANQPDPGAMSEFMYAYSVQLGQQFVPAFQPKFMPPAVPVMGYLPVPYCVPHATPGAYQSVCGELPTFMAQLHL